MPEGTRKVNQAGLDFYDKLVDGLLESGIRPYATLYHWTCRRRCRTRRVPSRDTGVRVRRVRVGDRRQTGDASATGFTVTSRLLGVDRSPGRQDGAGHQGTSTKQVPAAHHLLLGHDCRVGAANNRHRRSGSARC